MALAAPSRTGRSHRGPSRRHRPTGAAAARCRAARRTPCRGRGGGRRDPLAVRSVGYGTLIGDRRFGLASDGKAPLKDAAGLTVIGQSIPREDMPDKVTGRFTYMQDVRIPGMLHARPIRPPAIEHESIQRLDQSPWDVGEPATTLATAAISNAIFDATGARLWRAPFTPENESNRH